MMEMDMDEFIYNPDDYVNDNENSDHDNLNDMNQR